MWSFLILNQVQRCNLIILETLSQQYKLIQDMLHKEAEFLIRQSPGIRHVTIPFVPGINPRIRSILDKYDFDVWFSYTSTISKSSPDNTRNVVFEIPCLGCEYVYHDQKETC